MSATEFLVGQYNDTLGAAAPPPKAPPSPWMFYEDTNNWWYAMAGINVVHGLFLLYALWSQPARDSHERSLRLEMQQQIQRSRDLGVTSSSTSSAASPPPLAQSHPT